VSWIVISNNKKTQNCELRDNKKFQTSKLLNFKKVEKKEMGGLGLPLPISRKLKTLTSKIIRKL
jgi:hypothetical protein